MTIPNVTMDLADWIVGLKSNEIPENVRAEGVRTFVNWLGCAVGGAGHETVDRAIAAVSQFSGGEHATVIGRPERFDVLHAALLNGISSHVLDYDDTHLKTIIHPAGPVASAAIAVAERHPVSGAELLDAMIVGVEVECRIGNSIYPDHYDRGWHITGTAGVFGAAAATARLLGLDQQRTAWALSLAATQSAGIREMFGTMTKSFHPGRAAQNGAMASYLAQAGFDSSLRGIEALRGFANIYSDKQDYIEILGELGQRWEAALNSYKPFACGIVIHPTIDGCIQLRSELSVGAGDVEAIELLTHPLVLELTGKKTPKTGLESKFSVYHAAAAALLKGDGSPDAFTDEMASDPEIISVRDRVSAVAGEGIEEDQVVIKLRLRDGRVIEKRIDHAIGSIERPLSNDQLETKFNRQAEPIIGSTRSAELLKSAWRLAEANSITEIITCSVPVA